MGAGFKADSITESGENTDTAGNTTADYTLAMELAELLKLHNGGNVVVIDLRKLMMWTDFFVIATVTSSTHLAGLQRQVKEFVRENDMLIQHSRRRDKKEDEWDLIDLGTIVVHLMTEKARGFYELENLWNDGAIKHIG